MRRCVASVVPSLASSAPLSTQFSRPSADDDDEDDDNYDDDDDDEPYDVEAERKALRDAGIFAVDCFFWSAH